MVHSVGPAFDSRPRPAGPAWWPTRPMPLVRWERPRSVTAPSSRGWRGGRWRYEHERRTTLSWNGEDNKVSPGTAADSEEGGGGIGCGILTVGQLRWSKAAVEAPAAPEGWGESEARTIRGREGDADEAHRRGRLAVALHTIPPRRWLSGDQWWMRWKGGARGVLHDSLGEENMARGGKTWARRLSPLLKGGSGVEQWWGGGYGGNAMRQGLGRGPAQHGRRPVGRQEPGSGGHGRVTAPARRTGGLRLQCSGFYPFKLVKWFKPCLNLTF
jgi:hypothetical protein